MFPWASQGTPGASQGPRENFGKFWHFSKKLDFFPEFSWILVVVVVVVVGVGVVVVVVVVVYNG